MRTTNQRGASRVNVEERAELEEELQAGYRDVESGNVLDARLVLTVWDGRREQAPKL